MDTDSSPLTVLEQLEELSSQLAATEVLVKGPDGALAEREEVKNGKGWL